MIKETIEKYNPRVVRTIVGSLQNKIKNLEIVAGKKLPPQDLNSDWQYEVAEELGIKPKNLYECFFDIDGQFILAKLIDLAELAINKKLPILFPVKKVET